MRLPTLVVQTLDSNKINISSGWLRSNKDVYNEDYSEKLIQPISIETIDINDLRFLAGIANITIRQGSASDDMVLWSGNVNLLPDPEPAPHSVDIDYTAGITNPVPPNITDLGGGSFTISNTTVALYKTIDFTGEINEYSVNGKTFTLTSNTIQYVCIRYNNGSPEYFLENDEHNINGSNIICAYHIWLANTGAGGSLEIHSVSLDSRGIGLSNKISDMLEGTRPYNIAYGESFTISETNVPAVRTLLITGATVYSGVDKVKVSELDSSLVNNRLTNVHHVSGVWTYTDTDQYNNTQYDNGTNLVSLGSNRYSVRWIYRSIGDDIQAFYYCSGNYSNQAEAEADPIPNGLPILLQEHCVLIGRLIIQNGLNTAIDIQNVVTTVFGSSSINDHNNLNGLQGNGPEYIHLNQAEYDNMLTKDILVAMQEPTGFLNQTSSTLSFVDGTRTFTISPTSTTFSLYYRGTLFNKTAESIVISNTAGLHFIYYNSLGQLVDSMIVWDFATAAPVALVYWTDTASLTLCDERHATIMDWATHKYLHSTFGTRYTSGLTGTYTLNNDTAVGFGLSSGIIADEDIDINIANGAINGYFTQPINYPAQIPVYYRTGTDGVGGGWRKDTANTLPYKGSGIVAYNSLTTGTWGQTALTTGQYVAYFIYATDNIREPVISVQGQRVDSNLNNAVLNNTPQALSFLDLPSQEAKLLYRVIVTYSPSYTGNTLKIRIAQVDDFRNQLSSVSNTSGGTGTVTSVALTAPSIFTVTGSPITSAGTLSFAFNGSVNDFLLGDGSTVARSNYATVVSLSNYAPIASLANYLPLVGGTLTGALNGTSAVFNSTLSYNGGIFRDYTANSAFTALYGSGVTPGSGNYSLIVAKNGTDTAINGGNKSAIQVGGYDRIFADASSVTINPSAIYLSGSGSATYTQTLLSVDTSGVGIGRPRVSDSGSASIRSFYVGQRGGGTNYFEVADGTTYHRQPVVSTSHLTLNGATRPAWGAGRNFTMLGGTTSIGQTNSGGDYLVFHNNSYYDGTNNRSISATAYSSEMYITPEGGLIFNSVANNGVNGVLSYPSHRFNVDKNGNVVVPGSVQAGNSMHATWAWDGTYAWFGHSSQNNGVNGYSGILHRNDGTIVIYSPTGKAMYLGIGTSTVMQIDAGQVNVTGNGSFTGAVDAGNARMQTGVISASSAWFGRSGSNTSTPQGMVCFTSGLTAIYSTNAVSLRVGTTSYLDVSPTGVAIRGISDASDASIGWLGEYQTSAINNASPVSISTSGTAIDMTSISLTAGDWDISSTIVFSANVSGTTRARAAISTTSATVSSDGYEADGTIVTTSGAKLTMSLSKRINMSTTTTVYLSAIMTGTFGVGQCWGNISARRIR